MDTPDRGPQAVPALEMRGITKAFPGVLANDRVDLRVERGRIHALLGENGAGKTTLMNVLYGLLQPDAGRILRHGRPVEISNPRDAIALGLGMVHQHFTLVPVMTVAENVVLGREPVRRGGWLDLDRAAEKVRDLSARFGLEVDPWAKVGDLPVGVRQRVEILKALYREAEVLILDEPTSVLAPEEVEGLFATLAVLAGQGKSIIFITHKLREVMAAAHAITVLRHGRVAGVTEPARTSEAELAALMVGQEVPVEVEKGTFSPGETVLKVTGLEVLGDRGRRAVAGVSFELRAGEILGLVGVQGNGQTELVEALTGLRRPSGGRIEIEGRDVTFRLSERRGPDVAHVPEDRHGHGLVEGFGVADNLILDTYFQEPLSRWGVLRREAVVENAFRLMAEYDVRAPGPFTPAGKLSGGHQQRLVVARELSRPARLLVAAQPTRGLDVGSTGFIHRRLIEKRDQGGAVLLVSTELDEVLALADRIGVMFRGRLAALLDADKTSREAIGLLMAGATGREEAA
ncbi:MAG: ABC transporter ATP-binding protein [Thermodesulfobacteriota bacterium]